MPHPPCMFGRSMDTYAYHVINTCIWSNCISACSLLLSYEIKEEKTDGPHAAARGHSAILCLWCLLVCVTIWVALRSVWGHSLCYKRCPRVFAEGVQEDSGWSTVEPWRTRDDTGRSIGAADITDWWLAQALLSVSYCTKDYLILVITYLIAPMLLRRRIYALHPCSRLRPFDPLPCMGGTILRLFMSGSINVAFVTAWWG